MRALLTRLAFVAASLAIVVILYLGPYRPPRLDA